MKEIFKNIIVKVLTWEARMVLARHKPIVVAITGVVGKTGTKDAVAAALSAKYTVRKSPKSFNSETGAPLTILGLQNAWSNPVLWLKNILLGFSKIFIGGYEDVLVLEIGADKPGDINSIASWLRADIVVITAVPEVPVHREYYPDSESVLQEKMSLINALKQGGLLITGDDDRVATINNPKGRVERVSVEKTEILYNGTTPIGTEFYIDKTVVPVIGTLGRHQGYAIAIALTVGKELGVPVTELVDILHIYKRTPGRMNILEGDGGYTIIDDSYNSSPIALKTALETLGELETGGKKVAILGNMNELGDATDREHRRAGIQTAHIADVLYTLGDYAKLLASTAIEEGIPETNVHTYDAGQTQELADSVAKELQKGDIVLIKGSQGGVRLERVVKELMQDKDKASEMLVRQESEWLKR